MSLEIREEREVSILAPRGDLVMAELPDLERSLEGLAERKPRILLDCTNVRYLSGQAMSLIIKGAARARQNQGDLKVLNLHASLGELFDLVGLSRVVEICESLPAALTSFGSGVGSAERDLLLDVC